MMRTLTLLLVLIMPMLYADGNQYPEGWHWYNVPAAPSKTPSIKNLTPGQQLKMIQQGFEEAADEAILYPTEANVTRYYRMQDFMVDHASGFAAMQPQVLLNHPELN